MNNTTRLIISLLIIISLSTTSMAAQPQERKIIKTELLESEFGILGDLFGVGNRFYRVTYSDGATEELVVTGGGILSKAAITEWTSTNIDSSVCYKALANFRVKTVQDSAQSYTLNHRVEVWRNDYNMNIDDALMREFPTWKVFQINDFQAPIESSVSQTVQILYEPGYVNPNNPNERMVFDIVEYQQKKTGEWIRVVPGIASVLRINVLWWTTYQSGGGRGDLMPGCTGAPMPSAPTTPTPPTTVSVSSTPIGATVTSSGSTIGTTPLSLTLASGESKILTFTKDGYVSQAKGVMAGTGSVSVTLLPVAVPLPTPPPTPIGTPVPTTGTPVPTTGTPVPTSSDGSSTLETEPAADRESAGLTYEEESLLSTTNILIVLVVALVGFVAYTKLYVQKGKGKRRK